MPGRVDHRVAVATQQHPAVDTAAVSSRHGEQLGGAEEPAVRSPRERAVAALLLGARVEELDKLRAAVIRAAVIRAAVISDASARATAVKPSTRWMLVRPKRSSKVSMRRVWTRPLT
jgi:hypothetical protein